jgi:hypothetical protein
MPDFTCGCSTTAYRSSNGFSQSKTPWPTKTSCPHSSALNTPKRGEDIMTTLRKRITEGQFHKLRLAPGGEP